MDLKHQGACRRRIGAFSCGQMQSHSIIPLARTYLLAQDNAALVIKTQAVIFIIFTRRVPCRVDFESQRVDRSLVCVLNYLLRRNDGPASDEDRNAVEGCLHVYVPGTCVTLVSPEIVPDATRQ